MEALQSISELKISTDKIYYDKKSKVLVVELPGFTFIGNYNKNTRISLILNDIHKVLEEKGIKLDREDVDFVDTSTLMNIHGNTKLKKLILKATKETGTDKGKEKKEEKKQRDTIERDIKPKTTSQMKGGKKRAKMRTSEIDLLENVKMLKDEKVMAPAEKEVMETAKMDEFVVESLEEEIEEEMAPPPPPAAGAAPPKKAKALRKPMAPPPPGGPPSAAPTTSEAGGEGIGTLRDELLTELGSLEEMKKSEAADDTTILGVVEPAKQYEYNINMGLQYYSVMMEKKSYLFYVYFSHQELRIADEEGKTVYTTTVKLVTKKKEPPVMDLRIEGEGFEVHPLSGKVEVKKDAVNPPVMIFSIMPLKSDRLKKIKESERRFINVYIDFEDKTISHTILSVIVQPKHFRMNLGPIHFNMNKGTAIAVSIISIAISVLLLLYSLLTLDVTEITGADIITGIVPQISSFLFVGFFLYTLIQGVYPIKRQFEGLLNFDKGTSITK